MESNFINQVVQYEYTYQIWNVLEEYFEDRVKSKIKQLKMQLKSFKKQGSTVIEYMARINQIANAVNALGASLSSEKYIEVVLGGLNKEYNTFITMANSKIDQMLKASSNYNC
ncbi:uncharacterized protein DS421_17g599980 [Arachis hypogaea]|nr:uncharacterized protein DS421_17g599980 [Arachis hypogaea]